MIDADHPYRDPAHPGNELRPKVKCVGCGKLGCVTAWGPWCFDCNVERMDRIDAKFEPVRLLFSAKSLSIRSPRR